MRLFDAAWAPSPRRVRVFMAEKGITLERVTVDLRRNEQLGDAFLAINPRGTVPVLELDDGELIDESAAICRYLEALHSEPALFGRTAIEVARIEAWTRRVETDLYVPAAYAFRNPNPAFADRGVTGKWPTLPQIPALAERGRTMWAATMTALDARLGATEWLAGDLYSFADVTGLVSVDFGAAAKLPVPEECANVRRWLAAVKARPSAAA